MSDELITPDIWHNGFVESLRRAAPYIDAHRGRCFVLVVGGEAMAADDFERLARDIALLVGLGVRVVLVHGARPQIEARLAERQLQIRYHKGRRVTDEAAMQCMMEAAGAVRVAIEAQLSSAFTTSGLMGAASLGRGLRVASGNLVVARPYGVHDGVDFGRTGEVRRIEIDAINHRLDKGEVVLLSPIGYSSTGETFNIAAEDVAVAAAVSLEAEKLVFLSESGVLGDVEGHSLQQLSPQDVEKRLAELDADSDLAQQLHRVIAACRDGVRRVHIVPRDRDGSLLLEFYTRDGIGNMITQEAYDVIRAAQIDDVGGILRLIAPLEAEGVLARRSREQLELEIDRFSVLERDGMVIGCAALYVDKQQAMAELGCLAVSRDYQGENRADLLLARLEKQSMEQGCKHLFVLTTQTAHWFQERGFKPGKVEELPMQRQALYNLQRNSKVFIKSLLAE